MVQTMQKSTGLSAPKERPILMSAPMVMALLDNRKTQTRRIVKFLPGCRHDMQQRADGTYWPDWTKDDYTGDQPCPHGRPGDRLWVKETFNLCGGKPFYRASGEMHADWKWKPSLFMRRENSRITLEIARVRCERLNDISEADARAEGCEPLGDDVSQAFRLGYMHLWGRINGPGSWSANPWVWVIEFRRVQP